MRASWFALVLPLVMTLPACKRAPASEVTTTAQAAARAPRGPGAAPTLVYLVRHAEKALDQGDDPGLTEAGVARSGALDALLSDARVTHLFATEYQRTQQTLGPISRRRNLEIATIPAKSAAVQVDALRALPPGSVAVVAGHSNTVPGLVRALGAQASDLTDAHYDRLFLVALARTGTTTFAQASLLRYGARSPD